MEDLISRQAVLDGIDTYINKAQSTGTRDDFISFAELVVRALPSVNPQKPKTGHWIKSSIGGAKICSICQAHMGLSSFKYCPHCGAKMESEESEWIQEQK